MLCILNKELNNFFTSLVGYVSIGFFIILSGLIFWILPDTSIIDSGYSSMQIFFDYTPYIMTITVSAISMGLWSNEKKTGMFEILNVSPLTNLKIIYGKYFFGILIILLALLLTFPYFVSLYFLADPIGNIDSSGIFTSYIGLFSLSCVFMSISLMSSSISESQVISFLLSLFFSLIYYQGFEFLGGISFLKKYLNNISNFGGLAHYYSLGRGLIDTRDLVHFLCVIISMFFFTNLSIKRR